MNLKLVRTKSTRRQKDCQNYSKIWWHKWLQFLFYLKSQAFISDIWSWFIFTYYRNLREIFQLSWRFDLSWVLSDAIPEWTAGCSRPCQTDVPIVYTSTTYCSLHPIWLCFLVEGESVSTVYHRTRMPIFLWWAKFKIQLLMGKIDVFCYFP